jgi:hypothetical protein
MKNATLISEFHVMLKKTFINKNRKKKLKNKTQ